MHNALNARMKLFSIVVYIPLASKCNCCNLSPDIETLEHVLNGGKLATSIWRKISIALGLPCEFLSWKIKIRFWFRQANRHTQMGHLIGIIPSIIIWLIWLPRCKAIR